MAFNLYVAGRCGGVPLLWAGFFPPRDVRGQGGGRVRLTVSVPCRGAVLCSGVPCCAVLCFAVLHRAVPRCAMLRSAPLRCAVPCRVVLCLAVLWLAAFCLAASCRVVLCCAVLWGGLLCCAAVWRAVLCCVVLCSALLCRAVRWVSCTLGAAWDDAGAGKTSGFALWVAGSGHVVGWRLVGVVWLGVASWVGAAEGLNDCRPVQWVRWVSVGLPSLGPVPSVGPCP